MHRAFGNIPLRLPEALGFPFTLQPLTLALLMCFRVPPPSRFHWVRGSSFDTGELKLIKGRGVRAWLSAEG